MFILEIITVLIKYKYKEHVLNMWIFDNNKNAVMTSSTMAEFRCLPGPGKRSGGWEAASSSSLWGSSWRRDPPGSGTCSPALSSLPLGGGRGTTRSWNVGNRFLQKIFHWEKIFLQKIFDTRTAVRLVSRGVNESEWLWVISGAVVLCGLWHLILLHSRDFIFWGFSILLLLLLSSLIAILSVGCFFVIFLLGFLFWFLLLHTVDSLWRENRS